MSAKPRRASSPTPADYRALAAFRSSLRRFLDFSAKAALRVGLTSQHYQVLLALKAASSKGPLKVGELAAELLLRHHSAVELIDRLENRGLVRRTRSTTDRRIVELRLTSKGESVISRLAATHHEELRQVGPKLRLALRAISRKRVR
jgi:DNA-binding MarR family transcriptional regulator